MILSILKNSIYILCLLYILYYIFCYIKESLKLFSMQKFISFFKIKKYIFKREKSSIQNSNSLDYLNKPIFIKKIDKDIYINGNILDTQQDIIIFDYITIYDNNKHLIYTTLLKYLDKEINIDEFYIKQKILFSSKQNRFFTIFNGETLMKGKYMLITKNKEIFNLINKVKINQ